MGTAASIMDDARLGSWCYSTYEPVCPNNDVLTLPGSTGAVPVLASIWYCVAAETKAAEILYYKLRGALVLRGKAMELIRPTEDSLTPNVPATSLTKQAIDALEKKADRNGEICAVKMPDDTPQKAQNTAGEETDGPTTPYCFPGTILGEYRI
uniref:Uncharacterized protein n=1 Tax=Romanomermis culicivorax TaxID=13658 RepID=A0A915HPN3_ROMCU